MIKLRKQEYNEIREPINDDVFVGITKETLKVNGVDVNEETARAIMLSWLTSMVYYMYKNSTKYIDLKKMVIYRDVDLKNLLTIEAKPYENAASIMQYYKDGGIYADELSRIVKSFVKGVLSYSQEKQAEVNADLEKINKVKTRKSENDNK